MRDISGDHIVDCLRELYERAAFVDMFAALMAAHTSSDKNGLLTDEGLNGFFHTAADLCELTRAVYLRAQKELP